MSARKSSVAADDVRDCVLSGCLTVLRQWVIEQLFSQQGPSLDLYQHSSSPETIQDLKRGDGHRYTG